MVTMVSPQCNTMRDARRAAEEKGARLMLEIQALKEKHSAHAAVLEATLKEYIDEQHPCRANNPLTPSPEVVKPVTVRRLGGEQTGGWGVVAARSPQPTPDQHGPMEAGGGTGDRERAENLEAEVEVLRAMVELESTERKGLLGKVAALQKQVPASKRKDVRSIVRRLGNDAKRRE